MYEINNRLSSDSLSGHFGRITSRRNIEEGWLTNLNLMTTRRITEHILFQRPVNGTPH
jgi:hypothetical protein